MRCQGYFWNITGRLQLGHLSPRPGGGILSLSGLVWGARPSLWSLGALARLDGKKKELGSVSTTLVPARPWPSATAESVNARSPLPPVEARSKYITIEEERTGGIERRPLASLAPGRPFAPPEEVGPSIGRASLNKISRGSRSIPQKNERTGGIEPP